MFKRGAKVIFIFKRATHDSVPGKLIDRDAGHLSHGRIGQQIGMLLIQGNLCGGEFDSWLLLLLGFGCSGCGRCSIATHGRLDFRLHFRRPLDSLCLFTLAQCL